MARPPKPVAVLAAENKSHKTKAELAFRRAGEESLLTGKPIEESDKVRLNVVAHAAFERLIPRMEQIDKNDELYGEGARRYCLNIARVEDISATIEAMKAKAEEIDDPSAYGRMQDSILRQEQFLQRVQDALSKFENDNGMTVSASLRLIPKKPEEVKDPLAKALGW